MTRRQFALKYDRGGFGVVWFIGDKRQKWQQGEKSEAFSSQQKQELLQQENAVLRGIQAAMPDPYYVRDIDCLLV